MKKRTKWFRVGADQREKSGAGAAVHVPNAGWIRPEDALAVRWPHTHAARVVPLDRAQILCDELLGASRQRGASV